MGSDGWSPLHIPEWPLRYALQTLRAPQGAIWKSLTCLTSLNSCDILQPKCHCPHITKGETDRLEVVELGRLLTILSYCPSAETYTLSLLNGWRFLGTMGTTWQGITPHVVEAHSGMQKQSTLSLYSCWQSRPSLARQSQTGIIGHILGNPVYSGLSSSTSWSPRLLTPFQQRDTQVTSSLVQNSVNTPEQ